LPSGNAVALMGWRGFGRHLELHGRCSRRFWQAPRAAWQGLAALLAGTSSCLAGARGAFGDRLDRRPSGLKHNAPTARYPAEIPCPLQDWTRSRMDLYVHREVDRIASVRARDRGALQRSNLLRIRVLREVVETCEAKRSPPGIKKPECLAFTEEVWTDMRPLSLRKARGLKRRALFTRGAPDSDDLHLLFVSVHPIINVILRSWQEQPPDSTHSSSREDRPRLRLSGEGLDSLPELGFDERWILRTVGVPPGIDLLELIERVLGEDNAQPAHALRRAWSLASASSAGTTSPRAICASDLAMASIRRSSSSSSKPSSSSTSADSTPVLSDKSTGVSTRKLSP